MLLLPVIDSFSVAGLDDWRGTSLAQDEVAGARLQHGPTVTASRIPSRPRRGARQ